MRITDFLRAERIAPDLKATDKTAALAELADLFGGNDQVDHDAVLQAMVEREQAASTGMEYGVAVPHGRLKTAGGLVGVLGRSRQGIEFGALDGRPAHLLFGLVGPSADMSGLMLKALARISRLCKNADFRARLMGAGGAEEMFRVMNEEDAKY